jgi:hypothetical protein
MVAQRSGSFPLMNIAQDAGVDYGDVLLVADHYRRLIRNDGRTASRRAIADQSHDRMLATLGTERCRDLREQLKKAADRRWAR